MVSITDGGQIGGALLIAYIMAVLYFHILQIYPKNPEWEDRDRFILSKSEPALTKRIGTEDTFGESGSLKDLFFKYGLASENIAKETINLFEKKKKYLYLKEQLI